MSGGREYYDPPAERRAYLIAQAVRVTGPCKACRAMRPLSGDGVCGPCHYGNELLKSQPGLKHGELCDDCAFRPGSPERETTSEFLQYECLTTVEFIKKHALDQIFYCHKPFLDSRQEWGYDPETKSLVPLYGEHWRACGGWIGTHKRELKRHGYIVEDES